MAFKLKVCARFTHQVQLDAVLSPPGDTSVIAAATSSRISVKLPHGGEESQLGGTEKSRVET